MPCHQEDTSNPFFSYDPEKCIMCRRCARVCQLRQGRDVLSIANRGFETKMMPSYGQAFDQSICESCGNCVSSCPTGALTAKIRKSTAMGNPENSYNLSALWDRLSDEFTR